MFYIYNIREDKLLSNLCNHYTDHEVDLEWCQKELVHFGLAYGFSGNLIQTYIAYFLMMDENLFSLSRERVSHSPNDSAREMALKDIASIRELYLGTYNVAPEILEFKNESEGSNFNDRAIFMIHRLTSELAASNTAEDFLESLEHAYASYGVGDIGLHKAFRIDENSSPVPIRRISPVVLNDLVGLEKQKEELTFNTKSFVSGMPANNCLLYGDAGTGKSTSIKAIANEYYGQGLRVIEIYKHQLKDINKVIAKIKDRNYKFILYMDDLSFEEFETEYKYLKAVIEGGLEKRPDNVLIYATSNRRHLVRESFADRNDDVHRADTMQEKLSLFSRFGVTIYFGAPDKKEYATILVSLKEKYGIEMTDEELIEAGNTWEIRHGGRSGRTATQFIEYLAGKKSSK